MPTSAAEPGLTSSTARAGRLQRRRLGGAGERSGASVMVVVSLFKV